VRKILCQNFKPFQRNRQKILGVYVFAALCICIIGDHGFQVPLRFRPGNRYRVTVRGLRQRLTSTAITDTPDTDAAEMTFDVLHKGVTEFRTGEGQCLCYSVTSASEA